MKKKEKEKMSYDNNYIIPTKLLILSKCRLLSLCKGESWPGWSLKLFIALAFYDFMIH